MSLPCSLYHREKIPPNSSKGYFNLWLKKSKWEGLRKWARKYVHSWNRLYFEVSWVKRDPPLLPSGFIFYSFSDPCNVQGNWKSCSLKGPLQLRSFISQQAIYGSFSHLPLYLHTQNISVIAKSYAFLKVQLNGHSSRKMVMPELGGALLALTPRACYLFLYHGNSLIDLVTLFFNCCIQYILPNGKVRCH